MRRPTVSASRGTLLAAAEVRRRVGARRRVQLDAPHPASVARPGLVEGDVAVATEPEHGEVDRRVVEQSLVARALRLGVGSEPSSVWTVRNRSRASSRRRYAA